MATQRSIRGQTQRITGADIAAGRIRIPISDRTKELLPRTKAEIPVVLKGRPIGTCRYDPRLGPDRERSGVLSVGSTTLTRLVREGERLQVVRNRAGVFYIGDRGSKL